MAGTRQGRMGTSPMAEASWLQTTQALQARGHGERELAQRVTLHRGRGEGPTVALPLLTDQGHHQDEFPAVQQRSQAAEMVDETVGVWD